MVLVWRIMDNSPNSPNFPPPNFPAIRYAIACIHTTCIAGYSHESSHTVNVNMYMCTTVVLNSIMNSNVKYHCDKMSRYHDTIISTKFLKYFAHQQHLNALTLMFNVE